MTFKDIFKKRSLNKRAIFTDGASVVANRDLDFIDVKIPKFTAGGVKSISKVKNQFFYDILFDLPDSNDRLTFIKKQVVEDDLMAFTEYWKDHHDWFYFGKRGK